MNLQKPYLIESVSFTFALQYCNTQLKVGILYIKSECFNDVPNQWHFLIMNLQLYIVYAL